MQQNFLEDSLIILTKQTLDIFLKQENPSELIALYTFYYYTAKWQGTNQPKCTSDYVAKGLHWNRNKVARIKKQLLEFGLIEDVRIVDQETQRVKGYYIKMNYIFKKETLSKSQCIQNPPTGNEATKNEKASVSKIEGVENECTNALSTINLNALSTGNIKVSKKEEAENELYSSKNKKTSSESYSEKDSPEDNNAKKGKKSIDSYDDIINKFTNDEALKKEIYEFIKMRKAKKVTTTNYALKLALKKLNELAPNDIEKQIKILQQSTMNSYTGVFPLKEYESKGYNNQQNKVPDKYSVNKDYSGGWD